ncbi:hypothetical protein MRX96_015242 [Rhipicephalus microplus]
MAELWPGLQLPSLRDRINITNAARYVEIRLKITYELHKLVGGRKLSSRELDVLRQSDKGHRRHTQRKQLQAPKPPDTSIHGVSRSKGDNVMAATFAQKRRPAPPRAPLHRRRVIRTLARDGGTREVYCNGGAFHQSRPTDPAIRCSRGTRGHEYESAGALRGRYLSSRDERPPSECVR